MTCPIAALFADGRSRVAADVVRALPSLSRWAVYARIRSLYRAGLLLRLPSPCLSRRRLRTKRGFLWRIDPNIRQVIEP